MMQGSMKPVRIDDETLKWLDDVEKEYGKDIRNDRQERIEWNLQRGLAPSGEIPNLKPTDVPRIMYNGMVVVPNVFDIGDRITVFYSGWNIADDGEIIDIKWREALMARSPFRCRFEPYYKIKLSDSSIIWRFDDTLGGVTSVRQSKSDKSSD